MSRCRSCGAEIRWAKTAAGKLMPLDAKPEKRAVVVGAWGGGDDLFEIKDTYEPHFATCPDGQEWSGKGRSA